MSARTKLADPPADPVVRTLRAKTAAHTRHGHQELADASRRELEVHQFTQRATHIVPLLTAEERARIREIVDSAPDLSDEDAARIRNALPVADAARAGQPTAAQAVTRATA
jgi:hypothetical protein